MFAKFLWQTEKVKKFKIKLSFVFGKGVNLVVSQECQLGGWRSGVVIITLPPINSVSRYQRRYRRVRRTQDAASNSGSVPVANRGMHTGECHGACFHRAPAHTREANTPRATTSKMAQTLTEPTRVHMSNVR